MTDPRGIQHDLRWTRPNQMALAAMCAAAGAALLLQASRRPMCFVGGQVPVYPERVEAAAERIDPNTASAASLRRLPGIGATIARRIVEYRQAQGGRCFQAAEDLAKINRIGPVTVRNMAPLLSLPTSRDSTSAETDSP